MADSDRNNNVTEADVAELLDDIASEQNLDVSDDELADNGFGTFYVPPVDQDGNPVWD